MDEAGGEFARKLASGKSSVSNRIAMLFDKRIYEIVLRTMTIARDRASGKDGSGCPGENELCALCGHLTTYYLRRGMPQQYRGEIV